MTDAGKFLETHLRKHLSKQYVTATHTFLAGSVKVTICMLCLNANQVSALKPPCLYSLVFGDVSSRSDIAGCLFIYVINILIVTFYLYICHVYTFGEKTNCSLR